MLLKASACIASTSSRATLRLSTSVHVRLTVLTLLKRYESNVCAVICKDIDCAWYVRDQMIPPQTSVPSLSTQIAVLPGSVEAMTICLHLLSFAPRKTVPVQLPGLLSTRSQYTPYSGSSARR